MASKFLSNGYPASIIQKAREKVEQNRQTEKRRPVVTVFMPYINEKFSRLTRDLIRRCGASDLTRIVTKSRPPLKRMLAPPRSRPCCKKECHTCKNFGGARSSPCLARNLVYKISCCMCNQVYIGETSRRIGDRLKEHETQAQSWVHQHFKSFHEGAVRYTWSILHDNVPNLCIRLFIESHFINLQERDTLINRNVNTFSLPTFNA